MNCLFSFNRISVRQVGVYDNSKFAVFNNLVLSIIRQDLNQVDDVQEGVPLAFFIVLLIISDDQVKNDAIGIFGNMLLNETIVQRF